MGKPGTKIGGQLDDCNIVRDGFQKIAIEHIYK
jgi:hypothetical protein